MFHKINFSGFLHQSVFFSVSDLKNMLDLLEPIIFFNISGVQNKDSKGIDKTMFLDFYEHYLSCIFAEKPIDEAKTAFMFSHALASSEDHFFKQTFSGDRFLLKPKRSVIQLQPLGLFVSSIDKEIHTKTFAKEAQSFGLKISFPTIYEDTGVHKIFELDQSDLEYLKFDKARRFIRHNTKPLTIVHNGKKTSYPIRYSGDLKEQISKMSFFLNHGLTVAI